MITDKDVYRSLWMLQYALSALMVQVILLVFLYDLPHVHVNAFFSVAWAGFGYTIIPWLRLFHYVTDLE